MGGKLFTGPGVGFGENCCMGIATSHVEQRSRPVFEGQFPTVQVLELAVALALAGDSEVRPNANTLQLEAAAGATWLLCRLLN